MLFLQVDATALGKSIGLETGGMYFGNPTAIVCDAVPYRLEPLHTVPVQGRVRKNNSRGGKRILEVVHVSVFLLFTQLKGVLCAQIREGISHALLQFGKQRSEAEFPAEMPQSLNFLMPLDEIVFECVAVAAVPSEFARNVFSCLLINLPVSASKVAVQLRRGKAGYPRASGRIG